MSSPELTLLYVHGRQMGYGRLGVELAKAVKRLGVTIFDDLGPTPDAVRERRGDSEVPKDYVRPSVPTACVSWVAMPGHATWWHEGQHTSVFTMWETDLLPEGMTESIHEFDTVFVPSQQNVEMFSKYHNNVVYVPLGVDESWGYQPRKAPDQYFNFLIGGSGERKGTDLAFKAFNKVFPDPSKLYPMPRLVMKNPKGEDYYGEFVDVVSGRLTDEAEIELYAQAHCYLQPSRGEGFGLQPLQAIAQGCPTILTGAHGHAAFAHLGIPLDSTLTEAGYFIFAGEGQAGNWWEPDFEQLCEAMWDVYDNWETHRQRAKKMSAIARGEFSWENSARHYLDALPLDRPYEWNGKYHVPERKVFHLRVNRPWKADIGGAMYLFQPDVDYYESADVKRVLFDAGLLDPSCLRNYATDATTGLDNGLTPQQAAEIGVYSAAHSYCPTCSQRLNSLPTKADDIMAGVL